MCFACDKFVFNLILKKFLKKKKNVFKKQSGEKKLPSQD